MTRTRKSIGGLLLLPLLLTAGAALWMMHARAWDLGGRSPILNYDAAQYAIAGRELAQHGRFASTFALPVELVTHPSPPWPLAVVQPGLVLVNALAFKLVSARGTVVGSDPRAWLTLILPFCCYLFLGAALALAVRHLFARWWPDAPAAIVVGAGFVLGFSFLLDAEAQHFATSGYTELPFTTGLMFAFLGLALGGPGAHPFAFGLLLGVAGLFRANMLWLAPTFALAGAWSAPAGRRLRTLPLVLLGFAVPLAPWWYYKWVTFGSPSWDLTRHVVWDGVQGRTWFSLYHLPELPQVPTGAEAVKLLFEKIARNAPRMIKPLLYGPRGVWFAGTFFWLLFVRPPRPLAATGIVALLALAMGVGTAAVSIPWLRYMFPGRVLAEPIGMLAVGALVAHFGRDRLSERARNLAFAGIAVLAIGWGTWSTIRANDEARAVAADRGVPNSATITHLSILLNERLAPGETVMSNLGPTLAWGCQHPVLHIAHLPTDVPACRRFLDFRHIVLVFREGPRAWPGWNEIVEQEGYAKTIPGLDVASELRYRTRDGFTVVWLELAPLGPRLAGAPRAPATIPDAAVAAAR